MLSINSSQSEQGIDEKENAQLAQFYQWNGLNFAIDLRWFKLSFVNSQEIVLNRDPKQFLVFEK